MYVYECLCICLCECMNMFVCVCMLVYVCIYLCVHVCSFLVPISVSISTSFPCVLQYAYMLQIILYMVYIIEKLAILYLSSSQPYNFALWGDISCHFKKSIFLIMRTNDEEGRRDTVCLEESESCWREQHWERRVSSGWWVFDSSQRTNMVTVQMREARGPRSPSPWDGPWKESWKAGLRKKAEPWLYTLRLKALERRTGKRQGCVMYRNDGEARQLLRSAACCLPVLELISLNRALLQAIGLLM